MDTEWVHPDFDPVEFRRAAAKYIKLLIRARWKVEPKFLPQKVLQSWGLEKIDDESLESWQLLRQAATELAVLNRDYLPRCGSGGVAPTDERTSVGRLIEELAFFVYFDLYPPREGNSGGGPEHNSSLLTASDMLRRGESIKWDDLADWSRLPSIRRDLDQLPEPSRRPPEAHERYVFYFEGKVGHFAYGTPDVSVIADAPKGLFYCWVLMKAAPDWVSASQLVNAFVRYDAAERISSVATEDDLLDDSESSPQRSSGRKPQGDPVFVHDLSAELIQLEASLESAKSSGNTKSVDVITKKLTELRQVLKNQKWFGVTKPESSSKEKKDRDAVLKCLNRGFDSIGKALPRLALHLRNAIKTPDRFRYVHELAHPWVTQVDDDRAVAKKR